MFCNLPAVGSVLRDLAYCGGGACRSHRRSVVSAKSVRIGLLVVLNRESSDLTSFQLLLVLLLDLVCDGFEKIEQASLRGTKRPYACRPGFPVSSHGHVRLVTWSCQAVTWKQQPNFDWLGVINRPRIVHIDTARARTKRAFKEHLLGTCRICVPRLCIAPRAGP